MLQIQANTRGRDKSQTDTKDEAKKMPNGINPFWAGKAEQSSPGMAVLGSGSGGGLGWQPCLSTARSYSGFYCSTSIL